MSKTVVVIGGGASGMLAAYFSAVNGNNTILIEKNEKLGKKLYITGKGRCNLSNDILPNEFLENVTTNKKFLLSAINSFSPQELIEFFEQKGLPIKVERGERVFPASDKASDVTKCLEKLLKQNKVNVLLNENVNSITYKDTKINKVITDKNEYLCDSVIIATGGLSYPSTGSTGDGYIFAKSLGHSVVEPKPSLVGLELKGEFFTRVQGLSLKNVGVRLYRGEKLIYSETGEMIFTHYGVSGPLILTISSLIARDYAYNIKLFIDLKVGLTDEQLENRLQRDFIEFQGKNIANSLEKLLPKSMIKEVLLVAQINAAKNNSEVTKAERESLVRSLKSFPLIVKGARGFDEAVITSGGVSVKEVNPKTMESKIIKGLFFCGEVLDVDALTGGFNLQIAFSTAYLAGNNC